MFGADGGMDENTLAANYDPQPFLQMMQKMFGPSMMPQPAPSLASATMPTAPATATPMMPPAIPQMPAGGTYSSIMQPQQPKGGAYGVDSTATSGGTGDLGDGSDDEDSKKKGAPLSPQMLQMLQAMMPKPPALFLAPAGHVAAGTQANLQIPGVTATPTLSQLLRGG